MTGRAGWRGFGTCRQRTSCRRRAWGPRPGRSGIRLRIITIRGQSWRLGWGLGAGDWGLGNGFGGSRGRNWAGFRCARRRGKDYGWRGGMERKLIVAKIAVVMGARSPSDLGSQQRAGPAGERGTRRTDVFAGEVSRGDTRKQRRRADNYVSRRRHVHARSETARDRLDDPSYGADLGLSDDGPGG